MTIAIWRVCYIWATSQMPIISKYSKWNNVMIMNSYQTFSKNLILYIKHILLRFFNQTLYKFSINGFEWDMEWQSDRDVAKENQVLILTSHAFHGKLISTDDYVLADDVSSSNLDQFLSKRSQPTQRNSLKLNRSTHIN